MKFCPSCKVRLKKDGARFVCPQCGHEEGGAAPPPKEPEAAAETFEFNVLEGDEGTEALPTIKIQCEKCGHDEAVWWMLQTRSADEATTQFYRCAKCSHTWRNYD